MMLSNNKHSFKAGQPYSHLITAKKINIAIIGTDITFHSNLTKLMDEFKEIEIVFRAKDRVEFQAKIKHNQQVLVLLMDINIAIMEGFYTTQWIKNNHPNMCVMILDKFDEKKNALKVLEAETEGYTLKELTPLALINTIKARLTKKIDLNDKKNDLDANSLADKEMQIELRERELLFLQLCCYELTYKEIAEILYISPRTIGNYCENLFNKLGVRSKVGLVVYSIKNGLVCL